MLLLCVIITQNIHMVLNLDANFKPIEGVEIQYEKFIFSGGEPHIKITSDFDLSIPITITHRINSFNELGLLCMAVDALRRMGAAVNTLFIPYFPAARQDRLMVKGEPLSVKVYADIINNLQFKKVIIFDVHSDVAPALIDHCENSTNHKFVAKALSMIHTDPVLVAPDAGSLKKIYKLSEFLKGLDVIECSKTRDVKTGLLTGFRVYEDDLKGKDCVIVDDICDGGGTFIGLAKELKLKNSGDLYLVISHGIFSKGLYDLNCFKKIISTNSIREMEGEQLIQIPISEELLSF